MKKNSVLAIIAMAILAATVAFVSCKKDNQKDLMTNNQTCLSEKASMRQIDDMNAYLKEFRQKMTESKSDEAMNLEDAAWHLACLANVDFCRVNVEYNNVQFDTIEMTVNVTDGAILMSDLNLAYVQMCTEITQFKKGFKHCDQNLYYINVSIGTNGNAKIALMTTFNSVSRDIYDHVWYFEDDFVAAYVCDEYFIPDSTYIWNTTAARELQRVLNLFEHHENQTGSFGTINTCYTPTRSHAFDYTNTYDQYGSVYYNNSRVFAYRKNNNNGGSMTNFEVSLIDMCYCLDSYLGLGYDYVDNILYPNEHPVCWMVNPMADGSDPIWRYYYHQLYVEYGQLISINPPYPWND